MNNHNHITISMIIIATYFWSYQYKGIYSLHVLENKQRLNNNNNIQTQYFYIQAIYYYIQINIDRSNYFMYIYNELYIIVVNIKMSNNIL